MPYLEDPNREEEEQQFHQAFGEHTGVTTDYRNAIHSIKDNNNNGISWFHVDRVNANLFTNQAWTLIGRYVANNTKLTVFTLADSCNLTDVKMTSLFTELVKSSLHHVYIGMNNPFGIEGVRSMIPFLAGSPLLSQLGIKNSNFGSDCFELLIQSLHRESSRVSHLYLLNCSITDISVLETYTPQNLCKLELKDNNIGGEGYRTLATLLQKEASTLTRLSLCNTGMGDEETDIITNSLKNNVTLEELDLALNADISEKGCRACLKLLNDISSIENTYKSNHTLKKLTLTNEHNDKVKSIYQFFIKDACEQNQNGLNVLGSIGRAKVISTQLNSQRRTKLCKLQGIEEESNVFVNIETILLPRMLVLIAVEHGQSDLYTALKPTAPDLLSYVDRKAMIKDMMSSLTSELSILEKRLALIELGDINQAVVDGGKKDGDGEKRQRIN